MADSINRIVPPSVSVDRGPQLGRERPKKPGDGRRKPGPGGAETPAPEHQSEEPGREPADAENDKGKHLDINV